MSGVASDDRDDEMSAEADSEVDERPGNSSRDTWIKAKREVDALHSKD